jgi:hypothetical protein
VYILIDRQHLRVCHKHRDHNVVNALAHIELAHCRTSVFRIDTLCRFPDFTDYELIMLYQQSTGHKFAGFSEFHLRELVLSMVREIPESDVVPSEVLAQAATIPDKDKGFFRYVKGAKVPAALHGLYEPDTLAATHAAALQGIAGVKAEPPEPEPTPVAATIRSTAPAAPRGGSRATIFEVADKMWEAAGSPRDLQTVLALRKQMMTTLEAEHGIKKSTSSTALGDWQKQRIV